MATIDPRIVDAWSFFSHKAGLDGETSPRWVTKNWLPETEVRRLTAYRVLASYMVNNARQVLTDIPEDKRIEQREYGDPSLVVAKIVSGVLGEDVQVILPDMQRALADAPTLNDRPTEPENPEDELETFLYESTLEMWEEQKRQEIENWVLARGELGRLEEAKEWIDWWVDTEHVVAKITEAELEYAVPLGDSVYGLAYSTEKARPVLTLYPPDAYMPELEDDSDFPSTVHLVWEEQPHGSVDPETQLIRRITYTLVSPEQDETLPWETVLAYQNEPPTKLCVMTDVTFDLARYSQQRWQSEGENVLGWDPSLGDVNVNEDGEELLNYPLGIDFIPIVHVPNTPSTVDHFGTSSLARVARLLDDIVATDTDVQRASALAGSPILGLKGANVNPNEALDFYPGKVFALGPDGALDHVDMSASVDVLQRTLDALLERLAVNVQIPESMLGRMDDNQQFPSGTALRMSFQSFIQLIYTLRLARQQKFDMLLRFAQRLHVANGGTINTHPEGHTLTGANQIVHAEFLFGDFIPADIETTTATVGTLLNAHGISRAVASRMLQDAGLPIEDVRQEVAAISKEDTEGAKNAADATGSEQVAAELLGVALDEPARLPSANNLPAVTLP